MKPSFLLSLALVLTFKFNYAQIGINTTTPKASLEVKGKPTEVSVADGVIVPRISRSDLISKTAYSTDQKGALIFVTDLSGTNNSATVNITNTGFYYFDGSIWQKVSPQNIEYGDLKQGIQLADHNGWVLLDGRAISTLSSSQQSIASSLGWSGNLPDASDVVLMQNGGTLGAVSGSNSKTLSQNNLPNVTLSGTAAAGGVHNHTATSSTTGAHTHTGTTSSDQHNHTITAYNSGTGTSGIVSNSNSSSTVNSKTTSSDSHSHTITTTSNGDHAHTITVANSSSHTHSITTSSINGGVTQVALDITPKSMSVNTFVYLGL